MNMLRLALAMAAGLALPAEAADCARVFLEDLGWRFVAADVRAPDIVAGAPCDRATLAEARASGDLIVRVPRDADAAMRARLHATLLHHPATACAFGFALGTASRRAIDRIAGNPGYRFSAVQLGWIGFGATGAARDGWQRIASFGRGYRARGDNFRAIEAFYTGNVRSECGVARQVAQYATQAELYGREGFNRAFDNDEIVIGTFNRLHPTRSVLLGTRAGKFTHDGLAVHASRAGRQAFMGLPGFVHHVFDRSKLNDLHNQAENFVVYDVSAEAAAALRAHDGFAYYNARNREIWALASTVPGVKPRRYFERLLIEREPALRAALPTPTLAKLDALLADPFYTGFEVYVHRQGIKPVGFHIARLLDRNPRTPFRIELALHNVHTTLFDRYAAWRIASCANAVIPAKAGNDGNEATYALP